MVSSILSVHSKNAGKYFIWNEQFKMERICVFRKTGAESRYSFVFLITGIEIEKDINLIEEIDGWWDVHLILCFYLCFAQMGLTRRARRKCNLPAAGRCGGHGESCLLQFRILIY